MTLPAPPGIRALLISHWLPGRPDLIDRLAELGRRLDEADRLRQALARREGVDIPETLIISLTSSCDLRCPGCGIRALVEGPARELRADVLDQAMAEASALRIRRFALLGGEPLLSPRCEELVLGHPHCFFTLLTNGRPLTEARAARLSRSANCLFLINVGATRHAGVATSLDAEAWSVLPLARRAGLLFGLAATVTRLNQAVLAQEATLDRLASSGAGMVVFFDHVPAFGSVTSELSLAAEQRAAWVSRVRRAAAARGLPVLFVPEDEGVLGGCAAAGRKVVHLSVQGTLEPCPFVPRSRFRLLEDGLLGTLRSDFFRELRDRSRVWEARPGRCAYRAATDEVLEVCRRHGVPSGP